MNEKIKNYVGVAIIAGIVVLASVAWKFADSYSQSIQPSSFRSFSANGEGKVTAIPDVAQFTFSVITQGGKDIATLTTENTKKVNDGIAAVKSQGVEDEDIKTQNYRIDPRYQTYDCSKPGVPCPPADIVGYTVTQTVTVKVRDFAKLGATLSSLVDKGINSVSGISFTIDDRSVFENQARAEAVKKAQAQAEATALAGGFSLGKLLSIDEGYTKPFYSAGLESYSAAAVPTPSVAPSIQPGSQDIIVDVTLRYEIR